MQVFKKSFIEDEQIRTAIKKRCLPRSSDVQDMNKARAEFKSLCNDIKAFSGAEEFTGSFEEIIIPRGLSSRDCCLKYRNRILIVGLLRIEFSFRIKNWSF